MASKNNNPLKENPKAIELFNSKSAIWSFEFLNENEIIYTQKKGRAYYYNLNLKKQTPLTVPKIIVLGQGGLLDVAIFKDKSRTYVYYTFAEKREDLLKDGAGTSIARGELINNEIVNLKTIYQTNAVSTGGTHFGSRIYISKQRYLFITVGERGQRDRSQSLAFENGKVLRLNLDGSIPSDNPFVKTKNAKASIWSLGHRNPQGIDYDTKSGILYSAEFGPRGGDEINIIKQKRNYGWPEVTFGNEYFGPSIGVKEKDGMENPIHYWVPSISPSAIAFYNSDKYPEWEGSLFVAALGSQHVRRLVIKDQKVIKEYEFFKELGQRIRDIKVSPAGDVYFSTDSGKLFKVQN